MKQHALFIGRFQPFHRGHLEIIKEALASHEHLYLIIGSAQASGEPTNPYAASGREKMIRAVLDRSALAGRVTVIPVEDINDDDAWVRHVLKNTPKIDTVFAGQNRHTEELFSKAGFKVVVSPLFENITATEIRKRMKHGMRWHHMVPDEVIPFLERKT